MKKIGENPFKRQTKIFCWFNSWVSILCDLINIITFTYYRPNLDFVLISKFSLYVLKKRKEKKMKEKFTVKTLLDTTTVTMQNPDNEHLMKKIREGESVKLPIVIEIEGCSAFIWEVDLDPKDILVSSERNNTNENRNS